MTTLPQEGTTSNRYTILGRLTGGGMADIFLVRATSDAGVERFVVLKRVLAERGRDPVFAKMFLDEARLSAQLQHPNIAQVHDIGKLGGSYFYTMEYVHGEDVRSLLKRLTALHRPFPVALAFHVAAGALAALHHAHERTGPDGRTLGIVHRDVSPSNVMVSYEGVVKLLDFGVAKARQRSVESRAGTIKGKIAYLSPEQCHGLEIDRRSDLYSLGIVLYEMLTGRRLYKRDSDFNTMSAIVSEAAIPPSKMRPDLSPELDQIVLTALAKKPEHRFPTALAMLEAIEVVAAKEGHVLSATPMSRFMRELFGDRPVPWIELQLDEDEPPAVTVTGESLASPDLVPMTAVATIARPQFDAAATFEDQLEHAPQLPRPSSPEMSPGPLSVTRLGVVRDSTAPPVHPSALITNPLGRATGSSPIISTYPVIGRAPAPQLLPAPHHPRRALTITITAVASLLVAIVVLAFLRTSSTKPDPAPVAAASPSLADAAAATPAPPSPAASAPTPSPPAPPQTPQAPIDAAVPTAGAGRESGPGGSMTRGSAVQIADAVAARDFAGALASCSAKHPLESRDRTLCGIAACNLKQRSAALAYYTTAPRATQPAIDRACRDAGITLLPPVKRPPPAAPSDPCEDRAWADAHPLKCQK